MNLEGINQLITDVFGPNMDRKVINGWVSIRCPLAPYTHASGSDSRASAGISIQDNSVSVFNCYTCGNKAPIQAMLRKYAEFTGEDLDSLIDELEEEAYLGPRGLPAWNVRPDLDGAPPAILNKELHLDLYDPAAGHPYLVDRGITDEIAERLQLKLDPRDPVDGEERILFPVFSPDGDLHGFSGRATRKIPKTDKTTLKVRDYGGLEKGKCLLGAHLITETNPDKIMVVEGLFDYANGWQQGYPVVAVMHSTLTPAQARILQGFSKPTYGFYDDDEAGQKGVATLGKLMTPYVPVMRVRYPEIWIEDETEEDGGHWVKDPGELLDEDFEAMIRDARLF